jgi:hypothetical protein
MRVTSSSPHSIVPRGVRASPRPLPFVAALAGLLLTIQLTAGCDMPITPPIEEAPRELVVTTVAARFLAVARSHDRWVAVGDAGAIATSEDGTKWTAAASGTSNPLLAVAHDGKRWVAVGNAGAIVSSDGGLVHQQAQVVGGGARWQALGGGG